MKTDLLETAVKSWIIKSSAARPARPATEGVASVKSCWRGPGRLWRLALVALATALVTPDAKSTPGNYYWDINGATTGAGGSSPSGAWNTATTNWSLNSAGNVATVVWSDGFPAVFSAGTDATGSYTVTLTGTKSPASLTFQSGITTLAGGTVNLVGGGAISVSPAPVKAIIVSVVAGSVGLTKSSSGELVLQGANTFTGNLTNRTGTITLDNNQAAGGGAIMLIPTAPVTLHSSLASTTLTNNIALLGNNSTIEVDADANNTFVLAGVISGSHNWNVNGPGFLKLAGTSANTFAGVMTIAQGTLLVAADGALGTTLNGAVVNSGSTLSFMGNITYTANKQITLNGAGFAGRAALDNDSGDNTFQGTVILATNSLVGARSGSSLSLVGPVTGGFNLTKVGSGTVVLGSGANAYSNTLVSSGLFIIASSANGGSGLVTVSSNAIFAGDGNVAIGGVDIYGMISPGAGLPTTLGSGAEIWEAGGSYDWTINDATGTPGSDPGYAQLAIGGTLAINASSTTPFVIHVTSLDATFDTFGDIDNFDNTAEYNWTNATATGGISGFDPAKFTIDTAGFSNPMGHGAFVLRQMGNSIVLSFLQKPQIATGPSDQAIPRFSSTSFTVVPAGTGPLYYQWSHDGTPITSATSATYTVNNAAFADSGNYSVVVTNLTGYSATASANLDVVKATPAITAAPTASSLNYGQTLASSELSGTASVSGTFTFSTPATAPAIGMASQAVIFTPDNTTDYATVETSADVTVNQATPTLTSRSATAITYGQTLAASMITSSASNPYNSVNVPGSFTFTTPTTSPNAGTASQTVTFTPDDRTDYRTVCTTVSVVMIKATPALADMSASAITYGQTLGASTITSSASNPFNGTNAAGSFTFTAPTTIPGAGTATQAVTFTPNDMDNYNVNSGSVSVSVGQATPAFCGVTASQSISYGTTSVTLGGKLRATVPDSDFVYPPAGETVTVTINGIPQSTTIIGNSGHFSLSFSTAAIPAAGTPYTITYAYGGDDNFTAATADTSTSLTVTQVTPTITVAATAAAITYGQTLASSVLSGTTTVPGSFTFDAPATAPNAGTITPAVTFTPADTTNFTTASTTASVVVNRATPDLTGLSATAITYNQTLGSSTVTGAASNPYNDNGVAGTFSFTTPDSAPNAGTVLQDVIFTPEDRDNYVSAHGAVAVTVNPAGSSWTYVGSVFTYNASAQAPTASESGSSATPTVIYVGTNLLGDVYSEVVAPTNAGVYYISNTVAADSNYQGSTNSSAFVIGQATNDIVLGSSEYPSIYGDEVTFTATVQTNALAGLATAGDATGSVVFLVDGSVMATQSLSGGVATYIASSLTATNHAVTVTYAGDNNYSNNVTALPLTQTVHPATPAFTSVTPTASIINYGTSTVKLSGKLVASNQTSPAFGDEVTVSINGDLQTTTITNNSGDFSIDFNTSGLNAGCYRITYAFAGDSNFNAAASHTSSFLTVNKVTPVLTWNNPADITYGIALSGTQLNATATGVSGGLSGAFVYTPASGVMLNAGEGQELAVTFTPTDATDYTTASAMVNLNVLKADQTITFVELPAKTYGDPTFTLGATVDSSLPVSYASSDPTVASVSENMVTILKAGSTTITASQAGDSNHNAANSVPQILTVDKATLTVVANGENKTYDGNATATVTLTDNKVFGSDVTAYYSAASFEDKNVGSDKSVQVGGISITGADAENYTLANITATTTANISRYAITVSAVTDTRQYDGTTASSATPEITVGALAGTTDTAAFTQVFNNPNVGEGKTLTPSGSVADGNAGHNYAITFSPISNGTITAAPAPFVVYVDASYTNLPANTFVNWPYTGNGGYIIGYNAFAGVQSGINGVIPGGVVNVAAGSYAESVTANKAVTLLGANQGVAGYGSRRTESLINGGSNNAITITAPNVVVDGFALKGFKGGVPQAGAFYLVDNVITATNAGVPIMLGNVGIDVENLAGVSSPAFIIQSNSVVAGPDGGVGPTNGTAGIVLALLTGTAPVVSDNNIAGSPSATAGYILYSVTNVTVSGGTISNVMQGVSVVNVNPTTGTGNFPSTFVVADMVMSAFSGTSAYPSRNVQAGVVVNTSGTTTTAVVSGIITNVNIQGVGNIFSGCAGLFLNDGSKNNSPRQQITVLNSTINNNANRGIFAVGSNLVVTVTQCQIQGNGFNPELTSGLGGLGVAVRGGAKLTLTESVVQNPVSVANSQTVAALNSTLKSVLTVTNCSIDNNGSGIGRYLASQTTGIGTLNAAGNWWGLTSDSAITNKMTNASTVVFTPYLDNGTDLALSTPGFQGDFSTLHVTTLGAQTSGIKRVQQANDMVTGVSPVLIVEAGVYNESVSISRDGLTLRAAQNGGVDARGSRNAESILNTNDVNGTIQIVANNVTVDGMNTRHGGTLTSYGVRVAAAAANSRIINTITGYGKVGFGVFGTATLQYDLASPPPANTVGVLVDGPNARALLQNNNLTGDTVAGIWATNGAIVDAGNCGADITGLGTSAGGNALSGYLTGSAKAIVNVSSTVSALKNNFGATNGNDITQAFTGTASYSQNPVILTAPAPVNVVCASEIPSGARILAAFQAQGGYYSANGANVSYEDDNLITGSGVIHRTYTVTDSCDNSSTATQTITVSDTVAPQIVSLPDLSFTNAFGDCLKDNVIWIVEASDNCSLAGVVSSPASGSTFDVGTTTVTTIATDASGNTATNTFHVKVVASTTTTLAELCDSFIYGGSVTLMATVAGCSETLPPTGTVTFKVDGTTLGTAALVGSQATLTTASLAAGSHLISASYAGDTYHVASISSTLTQTIDSSTLTVTGITANNKVYDGTNSAMLNLAGARLIGAVSDDDVGLTTNCAVGFFDTKNIGSEKPVNISGLRLTGGKAGNYSLMQPITAANISPASLAPAITSQDKVYDGNNSTTIIDRDLVGVVYNHEDVSLTGGTAIFEGVNVGSHTVTATGLSLSGVDLSNYELSATTATTITNITSATLTVTAADASRGYGETNPVFAVSYNGFVGGETNSVLSGTLEVSSAADTNSPVGTYAINATGYSSDNYTIGYQAGWLSVTNARLTITADDTNKIYGQTVTFAGTEFTASGLVSTDSVSHVELTSDGAVNTATVGNVPYRIGITNATGDDGLTNYLITYVTGSLTINKADPTIVVTGYTNIYDGSPHVATATATGGVSEIFSAELSYEGINDTTYALTATAPTMAGTYAVTAFTEGDGNNSFARSAPVNVTITQATPAVVAHGGTLVYDGSPKPGNGGA